MVAGVGVGEDPTVGLGVVAGTSVTDDVGEGVGAAEGDAEGKAVVDRTLAVGVPVTPSLGLAPGALQAATRTILSLIHI